MNHVGQHMIAARRHAERRLDRTLRRSPTSGRCSSGRARDDFTFPSAIALRIAGAMKGANHREILWARLGFGASCVSSRAGVVSQV